MPHTPEHFDPNDPNPDAFRLPFGSQFLPPEFQQAQFSALDTAFRRQERRQLDDILGQQEERGFLRSGLTDKRLIEELLGPSIQRRQQALIPLASEGARLGREERLGELGFQRQRQFAGEEFGRSRQAASEDFLRQLDFLRQKHQMERDLLELKDQLEGGFGEKLLGGLAGGLGSGFGKASGEGLYSGFSKSVGKLF